MNKMDLTQTEFFLFFSRARITLDGESAPQTIRSKIFTIVSFHLFHDPRSRDRGYTYGYTLAAIFLSR